MTSKASNIFAPKMYQLQEKREGSTQASIKIGDKEYTKNQLGYFSADSAPTTSMRKSSCTSSSKPSRQRSSNTSE